MNMFRNKNKIEFKAGDSVKFKDKTRHRLLKIDISDWYGRVLEVHKKNVDIELDSITIAKLNPEIIEFYQQRNEYPHILFVPKKDLVPATPRDSEEDAIKAQDRLIEKLDSYLPTFRIKYNKWVRDFQRTEAFRNMTKVDRENTDFVLEVFVNSMYDYEGQQPNQWTRKAAKEVLLHWVPTKVSAEQSLFASFSIVLLKFLIFLEKKKILRTLRLQKLVQKVGPEIVIKAQDSSNWGVAKSFVMRSYKSADNVDVNMLKQRLKTLLEQKNKKR